LFAFAQRQNSGVSRVLQSLGADLRELIQSGEMETGRPETAAGKRTQRANLENSQTLSDIPAPKIRMRGGETQGSVSKERPSTLGRPPSNPSSIVDRYADVSFPSSVVQAQFYTLQIQILFARLNQQQTPIKVEIPGSGEKAAKVDVYIHAPDFDAKEPLHGTMIVPRDGNSDPLNFHLAARLAGNHKIQVDFMQNGSYIGTVSLLIQAADDRTNVESGPAKQVGNPVIGQTGPAPDLVILITHQVLATSRHQLKFVLHSSIPELKLYYRDVGTSLLLDSPAEWIDYNLQQILQTVQRQDMVERRLRRIGNTLWDQLIPDEFKNIYWQIKDRLHTILIVSDEPWIPWEMVRPYRRTDTNIDEEDFLCQRYALSRWIRGNPPTPWLTLGESRIVGVGGDEQGEMAFLPKVKDEIASVQSILNKAGARRSPHGIC